MEVIGELRWAIVIVQAAIGVFALTFLANLFLAPAILDEERESQIDSLQAQLGEFEESEFPDIGIEPQGQVNVIDSQTLHDYSGPHGIFFVIYEMRVFNRSDQAATIEFIFRVIFENEQRLDLPAIDKVFPVKDEPLPRLINLGTKESANGCVAFLLLSENLELIRRYIPGVDLEYLTNQKFLFEVREHITKTKRVFSASGEDLELIIELPTSDTEDSQSQ
jgi:hypothetical protein